MFNAKKKSGKVFAICALAATFVAGCKTPLPVTPIGQAATREFQAKHWEVAAQKFTKAIAKDGARYDYYFNRGLCYKHLGRNKDAIRDFNKANSLMPDNNGQAYFEIANLSLKIKDYSTAIIYAEKLIKDDENVEKAKLVRLQALFRRMSRYIIKGEYGKALKDAERLIKLNPNEIAYKLAKAKCLYNLGDTPDTRQETEVYLSELLPKLKKGSIPWKQTTKIRAINLFYIGNAKSIREARKIFKEYLKSNKSEGVTKDDAFWAGLFANVCLDPEEGKMYWSKLSKVYLDKRKRELKKK